jgi:hypothetical protein
MESPALPGRSPSGRQALPYQSTNPTVRADPQAGGVWLFSQNFRGGGVSMKQQKSWKKWKKS